MAIPFPAYRPTSWELQLPNYRVITNSWRATEWPEILGSLPEDARLRLSYQNITDQQALELLLLWRATAGGYYPLNTLPAEVAAGIDNVALANRILSIAPLSWVVAGPPRQDSVKNLRSGVDIELKTELRLNQSITIPTITCPIYTQREDVACLATLPSGGGGGSGGGVQPPAVDPGIWLSRIVNPLMGTHSYAATAAIDDAGNNYQLQVLNLASDPTLVHLQITKRTKAGAELWQYRYSDFALISTLTPDLACVPTPDGDLIIFAWGISSGSFTALNRLIPGSVTTSEKRQSVVVFRISGADGTLVWSRRYRPSVINGVASGTSSFPGSNTRVVQVVWNQEEQNIIVLSEIFNSIVYFDGFSIIKINPTNGGLVGQQAYKASLPLNPTSGISSIEIAGGRIYACLGANPSGTTTFYGGVFAISLDLQTVFSAFTYVNCWFDQLTAASDGSFYAIGRDVFAATITKPKAVYKLTNTLDVTWKQKSIVNIDGDFYLGTYVYHSTSGGQAARLGSAYFNAGIYRYPIQFFGADPLPDMPVSSNMVAGFFEYDYENLTAGRVLGLSTEFSPGTFRKAASNLYTWNDWLSTGVAVSSAEGQTLLPAGIRCWIAGFTGPGDDENLRTLTTPFGDVNLKADFQGAIEQGFIEGDPTKMPTKVDGSAAYGWGAVTTTYLAIDDVILNPGPQSVQHELYTYTGP